MFSHTAFFSSSVTSLTTLPGEPTTNELSGITLFSVIKCKIKSIEWLYLAAKGHRRAKFNLETNKMNWLVP